MFKTRKEVYDLIKNVLDDVPDIIRKQDDGTYYFAKSVKQEPSNRQSIMQDIVLEPQEAENYIKHANTKSYNKEMSGKIRADGGSIQSPQLPQGAKTLENPELKNFSSADDIIPQNQIKGESFVTNENSQAPYQYAKQSFQAQKWINDLSGVLSDEWTANLKQLAIKHPEMFQSEADVFRVIKEIKDNPTHFFKNNKDDVALIGKKLDNQNKAGNIGIVKETGEIIHANKTRASDLDRLSRRQKADYGENGLSERTPTLSTSLNAKEGGDLLRQSDEIIPQPNKNINPKANKTQKFYAVKTDDDGVVHVVEKRGRKLEPINGYEAYAVYNRKGKTWTVIEESSGLELGSGDNLDKITQNTARLLEKYEEKMSKVINKKAKEFEQLKQQQGIVDNQTNKIYAKGGDNLAAGVISGVEQDENGNLSINPAKFIAGLGGYTVAKKLLTNPKVQQGFKNIISEQIAKQKRTKDIINHIENSPRKGRDLPLVEPKDLNEEVLGYLQKAKRKVIVERISEPFKKALGAKFGFKFVDDIKRTISGDSINHTLKRHSSNDIELSRNGLPVSLEDIRQYPSIVQQADVLTLGQTNSKQPAIISGKQINGHYVIVEEVQTKQNELAFKTMYKVKGNLAENKMFRQSEASPFRVMSTATTTPLSNSNTIPNHPQKVKPADLAGNKLKGEYIKQKLESDTPHSMLYEADDIFVKDGKVNLGLDIKDKRILKYLKDNGFKNEGGKISAKATDEAIEIARVAQKMAYKKQVDDVTKKMLEC